MLYNIYFSAKGTTKTYAEMVGRLIDPDFKEYNWLRESDRTEIDVLQTETLLFSMPVYGGFIPQICLQGIEGLTGHHTPAIIQAIYGNRHYDDALIQMKKLLENQGFIVIAAGAFVAEHSIFPTVGTGRPDDKDQAVMNEFALHCKQLLSKRESWANKNLDVPGKADFDPFSYKGVLFKPDGDEACIECGACVEICPQKAISKDDPRITKNDLCISCGACIHICSTGARNYHGEQYKTAKAGFEVRCAEYREPETYYIL